jgi:hypothetical protein
MLILACTVSVVIGLIAAPNAQAATLPVPLGTASDFAVLAGSTITSTGPTTVSGDVGLSPGTAVTGFPPGLVNGTTHVSDPVAVQAKADLVTAYNDAAARSTTGTIATELGGTTQIPGVYNSAAGTFGITGTLTLDGKNDPNSVFIFKAASTLITASASTVNLINGAQSCNVFWQVGSSATLGTSSTLRGNVLALASITATTNTIVDGRTLTQNAAVTLDTNTITRPTCAAPAVGTRTMLTSSLNPSTPTRPSIFMVTVIAQGGAAIPTGVVRFTDQNVIIADVPLDGTGRAAFTSVLLTTGDHPIKATYLGSSGFTAGESRVLVQRVV